jgi:glycosyltransferase involved in cell wall biosynthesis
MAWLNLVAEHERPPYPGSLPWGSVDYPPVGTTVYGDLLELAGWALLPSGPPDSIEVEVGGSVAARFPPNRLRPDIAAGFPAVAGAERSGFSGSVEAPAQEEYELRVFAATADERFPLGTLRLERRWRSPPAGDPLVAVVIPCHNQAHFLADSVGSVHAQSYRNFEVVVVDDGSVDDSAGAARALGAHSIRQERRGPAAARNAGLEATSGEYVVWLDADNVLLPHALEIHLHCFEDHPECALVSGRHVRMDLAGTVLPRGTHSLKEPPRQHYAALLEDNYIGSPDNAMFRRAALDAVGAFDSSVDGTEDYDLYLRIAARYPLHAHAGVVSRYREHRGQFSLDHAMMLRSALVVLGRHRRAIAGDPELELAHRRGIEAARSLYGEPLAEELRGALRRRRWTDAWRAGRTLLRWYPRGLRRAVAPGRRVPA